MTGHRIPTGASWEPFRTTARVTANSYVVEHLGMLVDDGVEESNWSLALLQPLLVQQVNDTGEDRGRCRSATDTVCFVKPDSRELETEGGDIGECSTRRVEGLLGVLLWRVLFEILVDRLRLPGRTREDAGETTARVVRERSIWRSNSLLSAVDGGVQKCCSTDRGDLSKSVCGD